MKTVAIILALIGLCVNIYLIPQEANENTSFWARFKMILFRLFIIFVMSFAIGIAQANAQFTAHLDVGYNSRMTVGGSLGYHYKNIEAETGVKGQYQYEGVWYNTIGYETKTDLWLGLHAGIGYNFNLPQQDRHGNIVLQKGYTTLGIWKAFAQVRVGYKYFFANYSISRNNWFEVGYRMRLETE